MDTVKQFLSFSKQFLFTIKPNGSVVVTHLFTRQEWVYVGSSSSTPMEQALSQHTRNGSLLSLSAQVVYAFVGSFYFGHGVYNTSHQFSGHLDF